MSAELRDAESLASPFHPDKLALHYDRVKAIAEGRMVALQTIEVDAAIGGAAIILLLHDP